MGQCGGCSHKQEKQYKPCPLCHRMGEFVHPPVVQSVVKDEIKPLVVEAGYYICTNHECEIIFFDEKESQMILMVDIDLKADFDAVTKTQNNCSQCSKGCRRTNK